MPKGAASAAKTYYATFETERDSCRAANRPALRLRSWISSILLPGLVSRHPIAAASRATPSPIRKFAASHPMTIRESRPALAGAGAISQIGRAAMSNMAFTRIPTI
jgi:hypothetical protein